MSALDEVLREYFDTDGDKEVYNEAVSDLVGLIATAKQVTQLRAARDEARKIIGQLTWDITAITWMKKFGG